jgi:hypothetical protein
MEEVTFGVIPAIALNELRFTGEGINHNTESTESQELRSDRQVPDLIRTAVSAGGDANIELSYNAHDDLIAGAFMDDWSTPVAKINQSIDISAASGLTATLTDVAPAAAFGGIAVGDWVKFDGFANAANNGYARRIAATSPSQGDFYGLSWVNETGQTDISIDSDGTVQLGTTKKSFVLEKEWPDANGGAGEFMSFTGMRVSMLELAIATGSILTGRFSFSGLGGTPAAATVGTGGRVAAAANSVLNSIDNITGILQNGAALPATLDLSNISFSLNNNPRPQPAIGNVQAVGIGIGRALVTGTLTAYFETRAMLEEYTNFTQ